MAIFVGTVSKAFSRLKLFAICEPLPSMANYITSNQLCYDLIGKIWDTEEIPIWWK